MPVVVFDTNVLLSATGWRGNPFRCVELARSGVIDGVTCRQLLDELQEKLATKLEFSQEQVADTIADLLGFLEIVTIPGTLQCVPLDPDDDKVLECAVVAGANYVVTGDRKHLVSMTSYRGIRIVTPADFLALTGTPDSNKP